MVFSQTLIASRVSRVGFRKGIRHKTFAALTLTVLEEPSKLCSVWKHAHETNDDDDDDYDYIEDVLWTIYYSLTYAM